jgi:hypothetical protein
MRKPENLLNPPFVHNFVRMIGSNRAAMTKNAVAFFEKGVPYTLASASPLIRDRLLFKTELADLILAAERSGKANSRHLVVDYLKHFVAYDEVKRLSDLRGFDAEVEPFRASAQIKVPIRPNAVLVSAGQPEPLFSIGWSTLPFTDEQFRLMMTLFEDAVFTLDDFSMSKGFFVAFPKMKTQDGEYTREPVEWIRGDFELLSKARLREIFSEFQAAMIDAISILNAKKAAEATTIIEKSFSGETKDLPDLFD